MWSIHIRADGQALVSGSADKDVKFWEFESKPVDKDNVGCYSLPLHFFIRLCTLAKEHKTVVPGTCANAEDDGRRAQRAV